MLAYGVLLVIFLVSLLIAALVLMGSNKSSSSVTQFTNSTSFQNIFETAPFPVWFETNAGVAWKNKAAKKETISCGGIVKQNRSLKHSVNGTDFHFILKDINNDAQKKPPSQFFQTLAATFAHLQVGITVFDHENKLSLFNPAVSQHLGLRPEWLAKQPSLLAFFDRLRDTQIMPEPKNYKSWRRRFSKIERKAMKDDYRVDWELPDGRALRVTGRPHPSGTVVFLFEDVTVPLNMERDFRVQISNLQTTVDTSSLGLVVFDRNGRVEIANNTLKEYLGEYSNFETLHEFCLYAQAVFAPTPVWGDLRQFIDQSDARSAWQAELRTHSDEKILVNFEPTPNGGTLCEFFLPFLMETTQNVGLTCAAQ